MRKHVRGALILVTFSAVIGALLSNTSGKSQLKIRAEYTNSIEALKNEWMLLAAYVETGNLHKNDRIALKEKLHQLRAFLKKSDIWLRYNEPLLYKSLNAPLAVEWETEVFEKFEAPYKRVGAGLTLAELYLEEESLNKDSLLAILKPGINALELYLSDSLLHAIEQPHHFYFANRLFLLNLASIYSTGFECPDANQIVPELRTMIRENAKRYTIYNSNFPKFEFSDAYLTHYNRLIEFMAEQSNAHNEFDHYRFIKEYINPLYRMNAELILEHNLHSESLVDYSLNNAAKSLFSKSLFGGQNRHGIYSGIQDTKVLAEIKETGRMLFFDPLLSGNGQRSCASCHKPEHFFTDTLASKPIDFDRTAQLKRNAPSLINAFQNHLLLADGKHYQMEDQIIGVLSNPAEMNCTEEALIKNISSSRFYKEKFAKFTSYTPAYPSLTTRHVASSLMVYLSQYSDFEAPFDRSINQMKPLSDDAIAGFNLFMGKAECATCHFVPNFNGVKPPYVGSEFEVIGVPADSASLALSDDQGRFGIFGVAEMKNAFRTGTIRNAFRTQPYMHNGVFNTIDEVLNFYNHGGGLGHGLPVNNQTLSADSLHLSEIELGHLKAFIASLNEDILFEERPKTLPKSHLKRYKKREVGGIY